METFGSIIDKISILERRIKELKGKGESYYFLYEQQGWLIKSLGDCLTQSYMGERPFVFNKNKLYDSDVSMKEDISFLDCIARLVEYNNKLWDLEDLRRDKSIPDIERLNVCDEVSKFNKLRNDTIDMMDSTILRAANSSHLEVEQNQGGVYNYNSESEN